MNAQRKMLGNRQNQSGGDDSVNIQAGTISLGVSYSEARQLAMDVYEANFYRLAATARDVAQERAEALIDSYLTKVAEAAPEQVLESANPDMQFAIFTAQKEFARSGDVDLGDLLVQLLVDRGAETERSLLQIVLNESLQVAPKLTADQLDALTLVFILKYTRNKALLNHEMLAEYLDKSVLPFATRIGDRPSLFQHLEYSGCGTISIGSVNIRQVLLKTYPGLFMHGLADAQVDLIPASARDLIIPLLSDASERQLSAVDVEILRELCVQRGLSDEEVTRVVGVCEQSVLTEGELETFLVTLRPQMKDLFEKWERTQLQSFTLTSVGIAIAHANFQRKTGTKLDLSIWI